MLPRRLGRSLLSSSGFFIKLPARCFACLCTEICNFRSMGILKPVSRHGVLCLFAVFRDRAWACAQVICRDFCKPCRNLCMGVLLRAKGDLAFMEACMHLSFGEVEGTLFETLPGFV